MTTPLDVLGVADALASQLATVTLGTAVAGGTAIHGSTARSPNAIPETPYVVVLLPSSDSVDQSTYGQMRITHEFPVEFLLSRATGDDAIDNEARLAWLGPLLWGLESHNTLNLGLPVLKAWVTAYAPDTVSYDSVDYIAWRLTISVWTQSSYQPVAT